MFDVDMRPRAQRILMRSVLSRAPLGRRSLLVPPVSADRPSIRHVFNEVMESVLATTAQLSGLLLAASLAAMFFGALAFAPRLPTLRLPVDAQAIDFASVSRSRLEAMRAIRIPRRGGSWNRLVAEQDMPRIMVELADRKRSRRIMVSAWVAGASTSMLAAMNFALVAGRAEPKELTAAEGLTLVGWGYLTFIGLLAIPAATSWVLMRIRRGCTPLAWRLLRCGSMLRGLASEKMRTEDPMEGRITGASARVRLARIEAELTDSLAPRSSASQPSDVIGSDGRDIRKLSVVLESLTTLTQPACREVRVVDLYRWLDRVVDIVIFDSLDDRALARVRVPPALLGDRATRSARRILDLSFWKSPAMVTGTFAIVSAALILLGGVVPQIGDFVNSYPTPASVAGAIFLALLPPVVAALLSKAGGRATRGLSR